MKRFCYLFACLFLSPSAFAGNTEEHFERSIYHPPPVAHIDPSSEKKFSMMEREMQYMIYRYGDRTVPNHFCVVGYRLQDESTEAVVIWKESNLMIRWPDSDPEAAKEDFMNAISLSLSPRINMSKSLVESIDDMHGGTGTAIRADVEATLTDCEKHGKQFIIEPFEPPADEPD